MVGDVSTLLAAIPHVVHTMVSVGIQFSASTHRLACKQANSMTAFLTEKKKEEKPGQNHAGSLKSKPSTVILSQKVAIEAGSRLMRPYNQKI